MTATVTVEGARLDGLGANDVTSDQGGAVTPGTTNDAGTAGIQVYTVDFNEFFPSTQETQPVQPTQ